MRYEPGGREATYSELKGRVSRVLHAFLCLLGVLAKIHLDEGVALLLVHDASLNLAILAEFIAKFGFGASRNQSVSIYL